MESDNSAFARVCRHYSKFVGQATTLARSQGLPKDFVISPVADYGDVRHVYGVNATPEKLAKVWLNRYKRMTNGPKEVTKRRKPAGDAPKIDAPPALSPLHPPDPDKFNDMRAKKAAKSLALHTGSGDRDPLAGVVGLLTNLRHWCDRNGVEWKVAVETAATSYKHETRAIRPLAPKRRKTATTPAGRKGK